MTMQTMATTAISPTGAAALRRARSQAARLRMSGSATNVSQALTDTAAGAATVGHNRCQKACCPPTLGRKRRLLRRTVKEALRPAMERREMRFQRVDRPALVRPKAAVFAV